MISRDYSSLLSWPKAATHNMWTSGHGWVPVKPHLQKQGAGWNWPVGRTSDRAARWKSGTWQALSRTSYYYYYCNYCYYSAYSTTVAGWPWAAMMHRPCQNKVRLIYNDNKNNKKYYSCCCKNNNTYERLTMSLPATLLSTLYILTHLNLREILLYPFGRWVNWDRKILVTYSKHLARIQT